MSQTQGAICMSECYILQVWGASRTLFSRIILILNIFYLICILSVCVCLCMWVYVWVCCVGGQQDPVTAQKQKETPLGTWRLSDQCCVRMKTRESSLMIESFLWESDSADLCQCISGVVLTWRLVLWTACEVKFSRTYQSWWWLTGLDAVVAVKIEKKKKKSQTNVLIKRQLCVSILQFHCVSQSHTDHIGWMCSAVRVVSRSSTAVLSSVCTWRVFGFYLHFKQMFFNCNV